ncbi:MAG: 30S ribosome-binding factor RbfA [Pseudomonadota bacterium]|nr:30S ribosome-binding factor RbfA [Pseudomonadota bacterium]
MKRGEFKSRSQRQLRVGEVIRHALAQILERGEAHDPGLDGVSITVTEVRISPDLRNATAFVMPLGGADVAPILESLTRATPFFQRRIALAVDMRRLPALSFQLDESFDNATHIDSLLRSSGVAADLAGNPGHLTSSGNDEP